MVNSGIVNQLACRRVPLEICTAAFLGLVLT